MQAVPLQKIGSSAPAWKFSQLIWQSTDLLSNLSAVGISRSCSGDEMASSLRHGSFPNHTVKY
jgi:hypothetical protein